MITKYNIDISDNLINKNIIRLTNQLWKLIPMRENEENWQRQLDSVLIELSGINEIFNNISCLQLLSKLEGLKISDVNFEIYRKTIFESISLLQDLKVK